MHQKKKQQYPKYNFIIHLSQFTHFSSLSIRTGSFINNYNIPTVQLMKLITTTIIALTSTLVAMAQTVNTDSIPTMMLDEIVIEAPKVIRKADMDVYHPSKSAVEHSQNGLQLINNLRIPALNINDALGSVQAAGEAVQIRINGRVSSIDQVRTLLPETIKRIEWIDNPGVRYGDANYVINIIVSNPTAGGSLMTSARPILNQAFGFYMADAKFNTGKSQWQIGTNYKLTNKIKAHRDYNETFTYPDGSSLTRKETPLGGYGDNSSIKSWASYNYIKPDTTVFIAELSMYNNLSNKELYKGQLSISNGSNDIILTDAHGDKGVTPTLSLYWQQNMPRRQMLVVDFNTSLYFGRSFSDYTEQTPDFTNYITDIHTLIKDQNQAYAVEANYIKNWDNTRLTAGAQYSANRNRSKYENLGGEIFHQRQDRLYLFAEYFRRFGKWTATAGLGMQYNNYLFKESGQGNHSWNPRPQATITYSLNQNHNFRLSLKSWQTSPTLAETNTVPQQIDGFQWRVGNSNLKASNSYLVTFRYSFYLPHINGSFGMHTYSSPNAITPLTQWEDDKLVTTYENSRGLKNISFFFAPDIEIIPDWLSASGYLQFRMERMRGTGYTHRNNAWSGNIQAQVSHWGFMLTAQYVKAQRDLWGENISWGEDLNIIELTYNYKAWQFGAGIIMPFGKYDQGSKSLNKWNTNEKHMRMDARLPYIAISYNLQWGHQKRSAQKIVDIDANADHSTAGGR